MGGRDRDADLLALAEAEARGQLPTLDQTRELFGIGEWEREASFAYVQEIRQRLDTARGEGRLSVVLTSELEELRRDSRKAEQADRAMDIIREDIPLEDEGITTVDAAVELHVREAHSMGEMAAMQRKEADRLREGWARIGQALSGYYAAAEEEHRETGASESVQANTLAHDVDAIMRHALRETQ